MSMILLYILAFFLYYVAAIALCLSRFPECLKLPLWLENIVCIALLLYVLPAMIITLLVSAVLSLAKCLDDSP